MKLSRVLLAVGGLAAAVVLVDWLWGRHNVQVDRLVTERDSLATLLLAKIETVTVYVEKADRSRAHSDSSKQNSDLADHAVDVLTATTLGVHVTPSAPPLIVIVPPEVTTDLLHLRTTVADQSVTIIDQRAALSRATGALADAVTIVRADSAVIRKLQASQCGRKCKGGLVLVGFALGTLVR